MEISQEELDQFKKDLKIIKFQMQEAQDTLEGGIRSNNMISFRNTYVINAQDSLDASYPMYVHFNIIDEMVKIVSVKVEFWILNYRAYSKAGVAQSTPSGGADTSGAKENGSLNGMGALACGVDGSSYIKAFEGGYILFTSDSWLILTNHTHSTPDHTHSNHSHNAVYGIFEEDTSPTIKFYISESAGVTYSNVFGGYTIDKSGLDITSWITSKGSKLIKFTSTTRTRLSIQVTIKLDIKAR